MDIISKREVYVTEPQEMGGKFVNEAQSIVLELLNRVRGGILFIDEAYNFYKPGTYGSAVLDKLLESMTRPEFKSPNIIVILAGYPTDIEKMFEANQGLRRRFQTVWELPDWTPDQCTDLFFDLVTPKRIDTTNITRSFLPNLFKKLISRRNWGNAGDVITIVDKCVKNMSHRDPDSCALLDDDVQQAFAEMIQHRPPADLIPAAVSSSASSAFNFANDSSSLFAPILKFDVHNHHTNSSQVPDNLTDIPKVNIVQISRDATATDQQWAELQKAL